MSGVLLETGNISDTMVANIVMVSMIATPEILFIQQQHLVIGWHG